MSVRDFLLAVPSQARAIEINDGDNRGVVYATPLTCGDTTKLQQRHPDFPLKLTPESMVDMVILKALDAEGNKMFTLEDKPLLLRQGLTRVSLVASSILGETLVVEDAEKN